MEDIVLDFFAGDYIDRIQGFAQLKSGEFRRAGSVKVVARR